MWVTLRHMDQSATVQSAKPTREELVEAINGSPSIQAVADKYAVSRMTVYRWRKDYGIDVTAARKAA